MTTESDGEGSPQGDWDVDDVAATLRAASTDPVTPGPEAEPLPSRDAVPRIIDGLRAVLFPVHAGAPDLTEAGLLLFVRDTLSATLDLLYEQVRRELVLALRRESRIDREAEDNARRIVAAFVDELPGIRTLLDGDVTAAYRGDPAARSVDEVLLCYPGFTAVVHYRLAHALHRLGAPLIARMIAEAGHHATSVDIHPGAKIGASFFIDHGTGVVIGETAVVGQRVRLYQAVTLGAKRFETDEHGALVKGNARHPIVEDDVVIYAGATILGRVTIGKGSTIGGNVWLTKSVPPGTNVTQAQARSEIFDAGGGI